MCVCVCVCVCVCPYMYMCVCVSIRQSVKQHATHSENAAKQTDSNCSPCPRYVHVYTSTSDFTHTQTTHNIYTHVYNEQYIHVYTYMHTSSGYTKSFNHTTGCIIMCAKCKCKMHTHTHTLPTMAPCKEYV